MFSWKSLELNSLKKKCFGEYVKYYVYVTNIEVNIVNNINLADSTQGWHECNETIYFKIFMNLI